MLRTLAIPLATTALLLSTTANAQMPMCAPYSNVKAELAKPKLDEHPIGTGLANGGKRLVQLFVSPSKDTWTIVQVDPTTLLACIVQIGQHWSSEALPIPGLDG